jgi:hypothetical protein
MNMEAGFTPAHLPIVKKYASRMDLVLAALKRVPKTALVVPSL